MIAGQLAATVLPGLRVGATPQPPHQGGEIVGDITVVTTVASDMESSEGPSAVPFFFDDFETATVGQAANTGKSGGSRNFSWLGPANVSVTDDISHSGTKCLDFLYEADPTPEDPTGPDSDARAEQRFLFAVIGEPAEFALEYFIYFCDGEEGLGAEYFCRQVTGESDGHKCGAILWGTDYSGNYHLGFGYQDVFYHTPGEGDGSSKTHCSAKNSGGWYGQQAPEVAYMPAFDETPPGPLPRGEWVRVRLYTKAASSAVSPAMDPSDGIMKFWINDTLVVNITDGDLWNGDWDEQGDPEFTRNHISAGYLLGNSNSGFAEETHIYVDDVKFYDAYPGW